MKTVTGHFKSQSVDQAALLADRTRMRDAIFILMLYMPDMQATLEQISKAFDYPRHKAWSRIQELKRQGLVKVLPTTRNRSVVYQVACQEDK